MHFFQILTFLFHFCKVASNGRLSLTTRPSPWAIWIALPAFKKRRFLNSRTTRKTRRTNPSFRGTVSPTFAPDAPSSLHPMPKRPLLLMSRNLMLLRSCGIARVALIVCSTPPTPPVRPLCARPLCASSAQHARFLPKDSVKRVPSVVMCMICDLRSNPTTTQRQLTRRKQPKHRHRRNQPNQQLQQQQP